MEKKTTIHCYQEDMDWLMEFSKLHKIVTPEDAIQKLIKIHKAWNRKL